MAHVQTNDEAAKIRKAMCAGFDRHKDVRRPWEAQWATVGKYFDPTRIMAFGDSAKAMIGQTQQSRVYTSTGLLAKDRCASTLGAYLVNPTKPFLAPNVERDFMIRGLTLELGAEDREYLERVKWQAFYNQMRPKSGFIEATSIALNDHVTYGLGVTWNGFDRNRNFRWRHRNFKQCYIAQNEMGEVDTLWYEDYLPAWRVRQLWPSAEDCAKFKQKYCGDPAKNQGDLITVIYAVEPRTGPDIKIGAQALNKPFKYVVALADFDLHLIEEQGYDTFPYQVSRNKPRDGSPYASGLALNALPEVMVLNHYQRGLENNLDLMNNPAYAVPEGLFDELSFMPGAVSTFDINQLGFGAMRESIQQLSLAGNIGPVTAYIQLLEGRIDRHFYADAMELRQNGNMTATEIIARTDLRLRSLSDLVPGLDRDLLGNGADRMLSMMVAEHLLPPPTQNLSRATVEWDYEGPLAAAMRANQVDGLAKLLNMWMTIHSVDPAKADVIDVEMIIRNWADAQGVEPTNLLSRAQVIDLAVKREEREKAMAQMEQLQAGAAAVRDGAQGIASLAGAGGQGGNVVPMQRAA